MMRGTIFRIAIFTLWLAVVGGVSNAHAQNEEAESNYQQFLEIYNAPTPTKSELEAALGFVKKANQLAPNTYKYVFSIGAINTTLQRWGDAIEWLTEAKKLASSNESVSAIDVELNYCRLQLAEQQVASWGTEPVKVSFIMKEGAAEMETETIAKLSRALPQTLVSASSEPIQQALKRRLHIANMKMGAFNGFLVVALSDEETPATHYQKGIKDFYQFFRSQYFDTAPTLWITTLIAERPQPLLAATKQLYPNVNLPQYAPFLGYYNPSDNLIVATSGRAGYGTLLHEMVHALIEADFPDAPPWLNEGLASLYERTQWQNNKLRGLPNWRMDNMHEANISTLEELGDNASTVGLHSKKIAEYRLLLLFMDKQDLVDDLYRLARQGGSSFSLKNGIQQLGLTEAGWRNFLKDTFFAYRAEMAKNTGALSHPDEIRFLQQALKLTVDPGLTVDGYWGENTLEALMEFQRKHGLEPDGILGKNTKAELNRQYERSRIESLPDQQ